MNLLQTPDIKSKEKLKRFKEKMKDRHKINGIKFDYPQKNEKHFFIEEKKKEKDQKKILYEHEEQILLEKYNKLKHKIFLREQEEKEKSKQDFLLRYFSDFNYTTILKIIHDYLNPKNQDQIDPFDYDIETGKMAIDRANRNIKQNRINEILKRIILHFRKIKTKLNTNNRKTAPLTITKETIDDIRSTIFDLRPMQFDDFGFRKTLENQLEEYKLRTSMDITYRIDDIDSRDNLILLTIFRIVQELVINSIKHSKGNSINVQVLEAGSGIYIEESDDGIGISDEDLKKDNHFGLKILKERVNMINGNIKRLEDSRGTKIVIEIA